MKYEVVECELIEQQPGSCYYKITLLANFEKKLGPYAEERLVIRRSIADGITFTIGSSVYLSSPGEDESS